MSDYVLQANEQLNGGRTVTIGDYTLRNIGGYAPSWAKEYDTQNSFTDYAGNKITALKGHRFTIKLTTGRINATDYNNLVTELKKAEVNVVCTEFTGVCICDDAPADLVQSNFGGDRYTLSFTLTAKAITPSGGL